MYTHVYTQICTLLLLSIVFHFSFHSNGKSIQLKSSFSHQYIIILSIFSLWNIGSLSLLSSHLHSLLFFSFYIDRCSTFDAFFPSLCFDPPRRTITVMQQQKQPIQGHIKFSSLFSVHNIDFFIVIFFLLHTTKNYTSTLSLNIIIK